MTDPVTSPSPDLRPRLPELVGLAEEGRELVEACRSFPMEYGEWVARCDRRNDWLVSNADALLAASGALRVTVKALRDLEADACVCDAPPGGHRFACPAHQHAAALAHINQLVDTEGSG